MPKKSAPKRNKTLKKISKKKASLKNNQNFSADRDKFFNDHPNARVLLGIFIVSVAVMLGMLFYTYRLEVEIGKYLWETEGIIYNPES